MPRLKNNPIRHRWNPELRRWEYFQGLDLVGWRRSMWLQCATRPEGCRYVQMDKEARLESYADTWAEPVFEMREMRTQPVPERPRCGCGLVFTAEERAFLYSLLAHDSLLLDRWELLRSVARKVAVLYDSQHPAGRDA